MKCEFIDECLYAKEYIGRVCLYKAEICNTRNKIAQNKELEKIFSEEGYTKDRITIKALKALGKPEFLTIIIRWRNGKTTFLSVREVREKMWERSNFPSHVKELLNRIHDKFVSARRFSVATLSNTIDPEGSAMGNNFTKKVSKPSLGSGTEKTG